jgi:hypothetical protein
VLAGEVDGPRVQDRGFAEAFRSLAPPACTRCVATAFMEYNLLFGLEPGPIREWIRALSSS